MTAMPPLPDHLGRWAAVLVGLLAIATGALLGLPIALLGVAGAVLIGVVLVLWSSMQSLTGEAPISLEEAMSLGAPSAEQERKRAVLRALKDLEYERSVGKISEDDFSVLSVRYRKEAKELLRALDRDLEPMRARAAELLDERLRESGLGGTPADTNVATAEDDGDDTDARVECPKCRTANEPDARFCKACGFDLSERVENDEKDEKDGSDASSTPTAREPDVTSEDDSEDRE